MPRTVLIITILLASLCLAVPGSEAGWLDKLKDAGKDIGGNIVDDTAESQDPGQVEEEPVLDEETPWANQQPVKKTRKRRASAPVRTDLRFSADSAMINPEEEPRSATGRVFVDGARMRMDIDSRMDDGSRNRMSIIISGADPEDEIYTLVHEAKMYMIATVAQAEEDFWASFRMADNPCDGYQSAENLGKELFSGRDSDHWACRDAENADEPEEMDIWIDEKLGIPVQVESSDGSSYELKNISEGRPPADMFQLPQGYKKMSF